MKQCPHCGAYLKDNTKFCTSCGFQFAPLPEPKKPKSSKGLTVTLYILAGLILALGGFLTAILLNPGRQTAKNGEDSLSSSLQADVDSSSGENSEEGEDSSLPTIVMLERPRLVGITPTKRDESLVPSVQFQAIKSDWSNVINYERFSHLSQDQLSFLMENGFVVRDSWDYEFFSAYESNRYAQIPNFVTVDSMMHTYHLYFQYLMKNLERTHLSTTLKSLSQEMQTVAKEQYDALAGTEWEEAAGKNLAFFTIGAYLQDPSTSIPSEVSDVVNAELAFIQAHQAIETSPLTGTMEDYSQYKPRGYYEGEEILERYFQAMMWYGRINFKQKEEVLDRCALLIALGLHDNEAAMEDWEAIYTVTAFFAGTSDDAGIYEYYPAVTAAYGEDVSLESLSGNAEGWTIFHALTAQMDPPKINSVPMPDTDGQVDNMDENKGFRFMGQRFTIDEAIFQQLTYSQVDKKSEDDYRLLPDTLDVMAAFGSEKALDLLEQQGDTTYPKYPEQMEMLKQETEEADPSQWSSSLYASWLNTLRPLLDVKGEGYPTFMQSEFWVLKDMETFAGSYAELKHDTILYAKQMMAEMGGGGDNKTYDDRGYVEPEPEVFSRLSCMTEDMKNGLKNYGFLSPEDEENLTRLAELAEQLMVIAEKELKNELPTDEEFDLIRTYGGTLEHFWQEVFKDEPRTQSYLTTKEFPSAIIADIATDPNGYCLEVATGRPSTIYVVVEVDGSLRIATGQVFSFYQFEQPLSNRLTDSEWRAMLGIALGEDGNYHYDEAPDQPWWCLEYRKK